MVTVRAFFEDDDDDEDDEANKDAGPTFRPSTFPVAGSFGVRHFSHVN